MIILFKESGHIFEILVKGNNVNTTQIKITNYRFQEGIYYGNATRNQKGRA